MRFAPEYVTIVLNGETVTTKSKDTLREGDELEFTRRMGEKGDEGPMIRQVLMVCMAAFLLGGSFGYTIGLIFCRSFLH
jgi:hypothetical protein